MRNCSVSVSGKKRLLTFVVLAVCIAGIWKFELAPADFAKQTFRKYADHNSYKQAVIDYQVNSSILGKPPTELDIENTYWQRLNTTKQGVIWMLNAYYDDRRAFKNKPLVRVLTYIKRFNPLTTISCQLWFEPYTNEPVVVSAEYTIAWFPGKAGEYNDGVVPYFINCPNPLASAGLIPTSVSIVEDKSDNARNKLNVIHNRPADEKKKLVGICTKDLEYPDTDLSVRLVEWIEIVHLLGADMVYMYVVKVHPNMMKALQYLETQGKVKIEMVTVPQEFPGKHGSETQAFQQEMISLNDCFYKHIHEYEYILPIDTDEFIVPTKDEDKTWREMLNRVKSSVEPSSKPCSFSALNVYFLENNNHGTEIQNEVPPDLYFLQHVYRAKTFSEYTTAAKSFQFTENVVVVHNHYPAECVNTSVNRNLHIDKEIGKLHHYKPDCGGSCTPAMRADFVNNTVKDVTLWRYKDDVIANVMGTLKALKLYKYEDN